MHRLTSVVLLASVLLAGCGGAGDDRDAGLSSSAGAPVVADPDTNAETDAPADDGGCPFLPVDAVIAALGEEMAVGATGPATCLFDPVDTSSSASASVNVTELAVDPGPYADGTRDLCEGAVTEADAGDEAFACLTFAGPQGYYFEGSTSVLLDVTTADGSDETALAAAADLLASVGLG